jgi:hypothetical protein
MFGPSRRAYRVLMLLLPAERRRHALELESAFLACLQRERQRLGRAGLLYAWLSILTDTLSAAVLFRLDARRRRAVHAHHPRGDSMMTSLWQDVRYAMRAMRRAPGFSTVVVLTLALATGATTSIFGVVNAVLLKSLPFDEPDHLVMLYEEIPRALSGPIGFSAPDFRALEQRARSFSGVAAFTNREYELSGVDVPERVTGARVSSALFDVLRVPPALGRPFAREDDERRRPVAILSDGLWRRKFGANPAVVGGTLLLDRQPYTIVGILPRSFVFPSRGPALNNIPADVFLPISFTDRMSL